MQVIFKNLFMYLFNNIYFFI